MAVTPVVRGDTKKWSVAIEDADGDPFDLSGCTVWFTVKTVASNVLDDADAILQHKIVIDSNGDPVSADGFAIGGIHPVTSVVATTAEEGVLTQTLSPVDSTGLTAGTYVYDLQVKTAVGEIYTPILSQTLLVVDDITRQSA